MASRLSTESLPDSIHTNESSHDPQYSTGSTYAAHPSPLTRTNTMIIDEQDRQELQRIATGISQHRRQSLATQPSRLPDIGERDPALDPTNKAFDLSKWLPSFMHQLQEAGVGPRSAGVAFKDLSVFGTGAALQLQQTLGDIVQAPLRIGEHLRSGKKEPKTILHRFDGLLRGGETLIVLGRPGSGCSTLLKTMTGELEGLSVGEQSIIQYNGISQKDMMKEFKGETGYNQEVDKHFPHLTVGQTLEFAAACRMPSNSENLVGKTRAEACTNATKIVMAVCGLSHTYNTKVGNDFIRGVSGGERKRVSIAEMMLAQSPMAAWDNSTRGLDSATALKFAEAIRLASDYTGSANALAIYQASQAIYDLFDKAVVLYEGRQIYFGPAIGAKAYFERMGWQCPQRQTVGDFLTSVTNPQERKARPGMENKVPRTAEEFERYWHNSSEYKTLREEIELYQAEYPIDDRSGAIAPLRERKNLIQGKHVRPKSPYIISLGTQIRLTTKRAYQRIWNDLSATATQIGTNIIMALIIGSVYYGTGDATASFYSKGAVLFMGILMNALAAISEINNLYAQRPIVEKHASYAFYHPAAEAISGIVADIPIKFASATVFNIILYFLAGLRREPGAFFLFFLITFISTFVMAAIFRTMAAVTKTVSQAMMLAGIMVLALVIYTGFMIRVPQMVDWFGWIRWINPIFYAFEILIANEFHGREFVCSAIVPAYPQLIGDSWICSTVGAVAGQRTVSGDAFIETNYRYYYSHVWRNFGILLAFLFAFMFIYFAATELNSKTASKAEVLVFQRGHVPAHLQAGVDRSAMNEELAVPEKDGEGADTTAVLEPQTDVFTWKDVVYDIEIKGEPRRLLDNVTGWVKPGTLTALMGVSGAGKTTLLDVLAQRTSMGVITGDMFVNGKPLDASFQRKTGYVQQQDLHLDTSTVRESLRFSAMLRQPTTVSTEEKHAWVERVIDMLNMRDFSNAVVGVPGEGLNVEQRKLLTIGVELAAKPKLLLFLDEPTSGLDSQSSWAIVAFLRKLADAGQAVLCTVHQPSAILFQEFDRLLFLARGGKTVYFGNIGENSCTLLDYFEKHGARSCGDDENPAEWMLEIVNNATSSKGEDWHTVWKGSQERVDVEAEVERIHSTMSSKAPEDDAASHAEFAMPFSAQLREVTIRVFQQYWRMPAYIMSKLILGTVAGLFVGFSFFQADSTFAGMQNILFSVFMIITVFSTLVQQIQPHFITQRELYEVRERPSKAYSWKAFMIANIIVEVPYQILTGILMFACFYYPVVGVQSSARQGLVLLFMIQLMLYASSFAQMTIAAFPDALTASAIVTLLVLMSLTFCGVLQPPSALPGFWTFMWRVSPFTYWVAGIVSTELAGRAIECSADETSIFNPPSGQTCGEYMADYLRQAPGQLQNPDATQQCQYCSLTNADQFLAGSEIYYSDRWRNFGIVWAYIAFNIFIAVASYYVFRVKKWSFGKKKKA
ncbi:atpase [Fusarium longipes]|uniref:Atpase n=1 Tax=Fusarium longipes TaxID=694270 RepID=A0A395T8E3_9HYPO|nr:atpase [Fusarium longipes]